MKTDYEVELVIALDKYHNLEDLFNAAVKYPIFRGYDNYCRALTVIRRCPYPIRLKFWKWLYSYNVKKYGVGFSTLQRYLEYAK